MAEPLTIIIGSAITIVFGLMGWSGKTIYSRLVEMINNVNKAVNEDREANRKTTDKIVEELKALTKSDADRTAAFQNNVQAKYDALFEKFLTADKEQAGKVTAIGEKLNAHLIDAKEREGGLKLMISQNNDQYTSLVTTLNLILSKLDK